MQGRVWRVIFPGPHHPSVWKEKVDLEKAATFNIHWRTVRPARPVKRAQRPTSGHRRAYVRTPVGGGKLIVTGTQRLLVEWVSTRRQTQPQQEV